MNTYPSKCDWWIVGVGWITIGVLLCTLIMVWISPGWHGSRAIVSAVLLLSMGFIVHVLRRTAYDVSDDVLVVRSGIIRWNVPISAITSVTPSRSILSGPALSLDRLRVAYQGSWLGLLISPEDPDAFLVDLAGRSPHLRVVGGTIVRIDQNS